MVAGDDERGERHQAGWRHAHGRTHRRHHRERVGELVAIAEEGASAEDPGRALENFLRRLAGEAAVKRDLPDALTAPRSAAAEMRRALGLLLSRAQDRRLARPDLTVDDLMALTKALESGLPAPRIRL